MGVCGVFKIFGGCLQDLWWVSTPPLRAPGLAKCGDDVVRALVRTRFVSVKPYTHDNVGRQEIGVDPPDLERTPGFVQDCGVESSDT